MKCYTCGAALPDTDRKLSFRATCDVCLADLHCCKNCKNYKPGCPNDCLIPGTDYVADRSKNNFCEEFSLLGTYTPSKNEESKRRFDDLFK